MRGRFGLSFHAVSRHAAGSRADPPSGSGRVHRTVKGSPISNEDQAVREASDDDRRARAIEGGRAWAASVRETVHAEGRPAAGGWPGTVTEARARVSAAVPGTLPPEVQRALAKLLYSTARDARLEQREPREE
mgnify:CR=1 FL=1